MHVESEIMTTDPLLSSIYFLNRIRSLQWLCSESDTSYPKALLFIPGPDGRNNSGSVNILKYLFKGCTGKALLDETLDESFDCLEDMIILIKESTVSIVYRQVQVQVMTD